MSADQAREDHAIVMHSVMRMLCAGIVHGDLSEFNVLVDEYGPVIIALPQAVNAAANNNAQSMLARDERNMTRYYAQYAPELLNSRYEREIWTLFENGQLQPETELTGYFEEDTELADVDGVMLEIKSILEEEQERQLRLREEDDWQPFHIIGMAMRAEIAH